MRIAILGATSQIARDLIPRLLEKGHTLSLFARRPERLAGNESAKCSSAGFESFPSGTFDAVLNCVGVGDPARAAAMGAGILDVTRTYDDLSLAYVQANPGCRYVFLSSGAAYGSSFDEPANEDTPAVVPLNHLGSEHWYGLAKLMAEARHRSLPTLPIVDLRVFSYFSHTQDPAGRFLISDILRAIRQTATLVTSPDFIVRDYVHPDDLHRLVEAVLASTAANTALDVYSRAPVEKPVLLEAMRERFGLRYELATRQAGVNATGTKPYYFSLDRRAARVGYAPAHTSLDGVLRECELALKQGRPGAAS